MNNIPQTVAEAQLGQKILSEEISVETLRAKLERAIALENSKRIDKVDCDLMMLKLVTPLLALLQVVESRKSNDPDFSVLKTIESANDSRLSMTMDELWLALQNLGTDITERLIRQVAGLRLRTRLLPIIQLQDKDTFLLLSHEKDLECDIDKFGRIVNFVERANRVFEEKELTALSRAINELFRKDSAIKEYYSVFINCIQGFSSRGIELRNACERLSIWCLFSIKACYEQLEPEERKFLSSILHDQVIAYKLDCWLPKLEADKENNIGFVSFEDYFDYVAADKESTDIRNSVFYKQVAGTLNADSTEDLSSSTAYDWESDDYEEGSDLAEIERVLKECKDSISDSGCEEVLEDQIYKFLGSPEVYKFRDIVLTKNTDTGGFRNRYIGLDQEKHIEGLRFCIFVNTLANIGYLENTEENLRAFAYRLCGPIFANIPAYPNSVVKLMHTDDGDKENCTAKAILYIIKNLCSKDHGGKTLPSKYYVSSQFLKLDEQKEQEWFEKWANNKQRQMSEVNRCDDKIKVIMRIIFGVTPPKKTIGLPI